MAIAVLFAACGATAQTGPATPPAQICGSTLTNPNGLPNGAVMVPPGDNSNISFNAPGTTYYFEAGSHTIGNGQYAQTIPASNSTFIGAPGAVLDGQYLNNVAFTGTNCTNVTIQYLTIQHFGQPFQLLNGQWQYGNINNYIVNMGTGWTVQ